MSSVAMRYGEYPDLSGVRRALVIKLRHHGDVLLSSPVFSVLKGALPGAQIDALVNAESRQMLEGHPAIARVLGYDRALRRQGLWPRLSHEFALGRAVRNAGYDLAINLTEGDRGASYTRLSGARLRVGPALGPERKWRVYTHRVKWCPTTRHQVERDLDALRQLGIFPVPEQRRLTLAVPPDEAVAANQLLAEAGVGGAPYLLVHPTSRWRFKCWPTEKIASTVRALCGPQLRAVFTSAPDADERAMVDEIFRHGLPAGSVNLAGRTTLPQLAALIQGSRLLLTVDSVPMHMACALQAPVVALFGPSDAVHWGPWMNPKSRVVSSGFSCQPCRQDGCGGSKVSDCLVQLPEARVLAAARELLA